MNWLLSWFFVGFNYVFERFTKAYGWSVARVIRISLAMIVIYAGLIAFTGYKFSRMPARFIPQQDQGYLIINVQLPGRRLC